MLYQISAIENLCSHWLYVTNMKLLKIQLIICMLLHMIWLGRTEFHYQKFEIHQQ